MITDKPTLYIRNSADETIDTLPPWRYKAAKFSTYIQGKFVTLTFTVVKDDNSYDLFTTARNVSFRFEDEDYWMSFTIIDQDELTVTIEAWSLGLEFNNEKRQGYSAKSQPLTKYFTDNVFQNAAVIGINEVSDKKITANWDGEDTVLGRLYSIANAFDAEVEFKSELNLDGSLKQLVANFYRENSDKYQGVGQDRRDETYVVGRDIKTVKRKEDKSALFTAIHGTGAEGINITKLEKEEYDAEGHLILCTYKTAKPWAQDPSKVYAPYAASIYPTLPTTSDVWACHYVGETEYKTPEALLGYLWSTLKEDMYPQITWEVTGYIPGRAGDTVRIVDPFYEPPLYLDVRISEQHYDWDQPENTTSTITNVKVLKKNLSSDILAQVQEMIKNNQTYRCSIETSAGTVIKNGVGSTILYAMVYSGLNNVTDQLNIAWFKGDIDHPVGVGKQLEVKPTDVDDKELYFYVVANSAGEVSGRAEVTITNISDGINGVPGKDAISLHVSSVNGNIFKNTGVSTTLTVTIYVGDTKIDTQQKLINYFGPQAFLQWKVKRIHELSYTAIPLDDQRLSDGGFIFTLNVDDIDGKATFACDLDF